jgi:hypothetical protein
MQDIESKLAKTQAEFPFPDEELQRTLRRRWITDWAKKGGIGAEIGVFRGHFAEVLLENLRPAKLYLVDLWTMQGDYFGWSDSYTCNNTLPTALARQEVELRAARHSDVHIVLIEGSFPECASKISELLDWVYLDATHQYENVLRQLDAASKMAKSDGVIMGDDWWPDRKHRHHGAFRAINRFIKRENFELVVAGPEGQWCIRRSTEL